MSTIDDLTLDVDVPAAPALSNALSDGLGDGLAPRAGVLFTQPGATEETTQWRAERMQLVNWGGFAGAATVDLHPGSTLLSGASGTGKSTLLDAYTALLMPSDVPFNGASNDAAGRSRGVGQRSLVSYLRGQTDTTADIEGTERAQVLRGDGAATWGGVAVTYVSDTKAAFTAARLYYVPGNARMGGDVTQRMLTLDGRLNLRDFEQFAADAFVPAKLRAHVPGLVSHDSYQSFAARLFTRLGIGANGDGDKALSLLARVQAGHQIRTVDALYKDMVLERPATYAAADQALEHFNSLADTYNRMHEDRTKRQILEPITDAWERLAQARDTIASVDAFGVSSPGASPLTLWSLRREADMVEEATTHIWSRHAEADTASRKAKAKWEQLRLDLEAVRKEHERAGGGDLRDLTLQIDRAEAEAADRSIKLRDLTGRLRPILTDGADLSDASTFESLVATGAQFTATYDGARADLAAQAEALNPRRWQLNSDIGDLDSQLTDLTGRQTRVPSPLLRLREQVCAATGLNESELPFLAELVDVADDQRQWRTAIETMLYGQARRMLVPSHRFEAFSRAIDPLRLSGVLNFQSVPLDHPTAAPPPADTVAGKLVFKDSRFRGWATGHLSSPTNNALCVATSADLVGPGVRVTMAGQIRRGTSGTHGRGDARNILGFSNADLVAELTAQRQVLFDERDALDNEHRRLKAQVDALDVRHQAFLVLSGASFDQVDVRSCRDRAAEMTAARERILAGNDLLGQLEQRVRHLDGQVTEAHTGWVLLYAEVQRLHKAWESLCERKDTLTDQIDDIELCQEFVLTDEQVTALNGHFLTACGDDDPSDLDRFPANLMRLRKRLLATHADAVTDESRVRSLLERTFAVYLERFPDPNMDATLGSYEDFARVLTEIVTGGLDARINEWRERLMQWSGQDLVPLAQAMQTAVDDIDDRMGPINDILRKLPFGATSDRLRMQMRRLTRDHVVQFRKQLKKLSSGATLELDETQMQARFRELDRFMGQLRSSKDPRYDPKVSNRDDLLDVRRHVEIRAERYSSTDGRLLSNYTSLGSKSGGETQELIAFIVGAALRFRLGDEDRARPRFAPVFLDEGFIKADAEFASRAVQAWTGLGFQLIVGAPLDKVAALEPHMDSFLMVTKNQRTKLSRVRQVSDAERAQARREVPA